MKKILKIAVLILMVALVPASLYAAEGCVQTVRNFRQDIYQDTIEVTMVCTTAANGTLAAVVLDPDAKLNLFYLFEVATKPGATAPTDDTDFTITDSGGWDILRGVGTDMLDNTIANQPSLLHPSKITSSLTLNVSNNSVNSAVFTIRLKFVK